MLYQYGSPTNQTVAQPKCWARGYDAMTRECRSCGFQTSCKDECDRARSSPMAYQAVQPYSTPTPAYRYPQPAPAPVPAYQQPVQQPMQQRPAPVVQQPLQQQPMQQRSMWQTIQGVQQNFQYGYGWYQDPLYYQMAAIPPPLRVQMPGESFASRVGKNALLAAAESMVGQIFLAIRQTVWAPPPPEIPVTPVQSQPPPGT